MDELTLLRELRRHQPAPDPAALDRARAVLLAEARTRPDPVYRPRRDTAALWPRLRWRLAAAGGLALAVTAGLLLTGHLRPGQPSSDPQATVILHRAALTAAEGPALTVHGDQYVFVESVTVYASGGRSADGTTHWRPGVPTLRQIWLSAGGTGTGLLRQRPRSSPGAWSETPLQGCRDGRPTATGPATAISGQPCQTTPAYLGNLPTSPAAMYDYLYRHSNGGNPPDQQAFITVGDLIRESYVPPATLSALFYAAARIPGVSVVHDAVDAAGRPGVAVSRTFNGVRHELIFDAATYAFLGEREVATRDSDGMSSGFVIGSTALVRVAVVDGVGRLP